MFGSLGNVDMASNGILSCREYEESDHFECMSQHGISVETFNLIQTKERLEDEAKERNQKNLARDSEKR